MSAFDFSADRIELKSIENRLKEKISARKKFLLIIVHESVGMKWNHDSSIFFFHFYISVFQDEPVHLTIQQLRHDPYGAAPIIQLTHLIFG